jgi:hypothetical protein
MFITKPFVDSTRVDVTVSPMTSLKSKHTGELYKESKYHIPTQVYLDHTKLIANANVHGLKMKYSAYYPSLYTLLYLEHFTLMPYFKIIK